MAGERRGSTRDEDPLSKLQKLIDESIDRAFSTRDKRAKEESDPWARLEGMIDRAVEGALDRRLGDLMDEEEEEPEERPARGRRRGGEDKDSPLSLFA